MRLIHFSTTPLTRVVSVDAGSGSQARAGMKPNGLWVSDENEDPSWRSWCEKEQFGPIGTGAIVFEQEIEIVDDGSILHLAHEGAIRRFQQKFALKEDFPPSINLIDWKKVAESFKGVLITPYCWSLRLEPGFLWYYGWDCASGVIWDASAIARIGEPARLKKDYSLA